MISFETERLICKSNLCVDNGKLIVCNRENEIDIINIKPATGEEGDFAFYCNGVDMYFVCRINITDKRNCFEILYDVKEEFWNQGYMTEALKAFCKWLFHNTDQNIIWALPGGIYKEASIKVLKKCNFIRSNREANQDWYELRKG